MREFSSRLRNNHPNTVTIFNKIYVTDIYIYILIGDHAYETCLKPVNILAYHLYIRWYLNWLIHFKLTQDQIGR